jgi:hypothetical protein
MCNTRVEFRIIVIAILNLWQIVIPVINGSKKDSLTALGYMYFLLKCDDKEAPVATFFKVGHS